MAAQEELKYTAEHEWSLVDGDTVTVGITAYAAEKLGDVVFVELPAVGSDVAGAAVIGELESTKSVGELFAPLDGTITEINDAVVDTPELVNTDPFGDGWLVKMTLSSSDAVNGPNILSYADYSALVGE
jgi:glycine cleavage system H protein